LEIIVEEEAGFCFGVKRAVDITYEAAQNSKLPQPVYILGPLIHNAEVVKEIEEAGVKTVSDADAIDLEKKGTVIIRSHGVRPEIVARLRQKDWHIIDATCPYVKKAQDYSRLLIREGYRLIIFGDSSHPEVQGILGHVKDQAEIIASPEEGEAIKRTAKIGLVPQTTKNPEKFRQLTNILLGKANELRIFNTICSVTQKRQEAAGSLASQVDAIIVVGGHNSSNTRSLVLICSEKGTPTYHIQKSEEINPEWFIGIEKVGIVAGASTPNWIIKEVEELMFEMSEERKDENREQEEQKKKEEENNTAPTEEENQATEEQKEQEKTEQEEQVQAEETVSQQETEQEKEEAEIEEETLETEQEQEGTEEKEKEELEETALEEKTEESAPETAAVQETEPEATPEKAVEEEATPEEEEGDVAAEEEEIQSQQEGDPSPSEDIATEEEPEEEAPHPMEEEEAMQYGQDIQAFSRGQIIDGKVIEVTDEGLFVDIGSKTEGFVPRREVAQDPVENIADHVQPGQDIKVFFLGTDDDGAARLSKKRADIEEAWNRVTQAQKDQSVITGKATKVVKGGLVVDVGLRGFIPASHIAIEYVEDLEQFVGQELEMKVLEVEKKNNNVVLSRRKVLEQDQEKKKGETLDSIGQGDVVDGRVTKIVDFGAFIDIGGIEGLLHISEMSWGRIEHPSRVLKEGQETEVKVLSVDKEAERISLGLKQILPDPWDEFVDKYSVGDHVEGTITKTVSFGAFMEIENGIEGLIHISQLAQRHVETPDEVVKKGDKVTAKIININENERKVGLSLKEMEEEKQKKEAKEITDQAKEEGNITIGDMVGDLFEKDEDEEEEK